MRDVVPGAVRRYVRRCLDDDLTGLTGLAAELAFRFLLALFPFGVFVASVGALLAGHSGPGNPSDALAHTLLGTRPGGLTGPIATQLHDLAMRARPDLLSIGALGTIYAAGGGMNALMDAMNRAYEVHETRPFLARIAVAVILTVLAGTGVVVAFVALVAGAGIIQEVAASRDSAPSRRRSSCCCAGPRCSPCCRRPRRSSSGSRRTSTPPGAGYWWEASCSTWAGWS